MANGPSRRKRRKIRFTAAGAGALAVAMVLSACGSGTSTAKPGDTTQTTSGTTAPVVKTLGNGVTKTTIKIGIGLIDYDTIKDVPDLPSVRLHQQEIYEAFIKDINEHGGVGGRKLVPVFKKYIPVGSTATLTACTAFADDDNVFAVTGTFYDPSGESQLCVTKQKHRVLLTFDVDKSMIEKAPPGLLVTPASTPERGVKVLVELLKKRHTLEGKTVAVLGQVKSAAIVNNSIVPDLKAAGVKLGATGLLNIQDQDTSQPESQLDSFIEKWKQQGVDTVLFSSYEATSLRFVQKVRKAMPNVQLLADNTQILGYAQSAKRTGLTPNPYEGFLAASGPLHSEYEKSANWAYCKDIYKRQTGETAPGPDTVIPYKGNKNKTIDTYGVINDACQLLTMFDDIATKVGPWLNNQNWINTVNNFGHIENRGTGPYSSLGTGKYDADDNFHLVEIDSSLPPDGNFKALTPLQDVAN
ncbi:MAG TPA: ABC transporter substrate-binding protein [Acidimicrobiia bacterium]|nr:ABC transporter substrate-binding protein [Acidimicrobiia bacterium]